MNSFDSCRYVLSTLEWSILRQSTGGAAKQSPDMREGIAAESTRLRKERSSWRTRVGSTESTSEAQRILLDKSTCES
jgi:hypothetical protein